MWSFHRQDDSQASSNNIYLADSPEEISQLTQTQHSIWSQPEEEEEEELAPAEQYQYGVSQSQWHQQQEDDEMMMPPPPPPQNYMYEQQQQHQQEYHHEEDSQQLYYVDTNAQQEQQPLHHSRLEEYDPPSPQHLPSPPVVRRVNTNDDDDDENNDGYPDSQGQCTTEQEQARILSQQSSSTQMEPVSLSVVQEEQSQHDSQQPVLEVENENDDDDENNNSSSSDDDSDDDDQSLPEQLLSPAEVIRRMEALTRTIVEALANQQLPEMNTYSSRARRRRRRTSLTNNNNHQRRRFIFHNMTNCRTFSNILLVLSFCHNLLHSQRTTTTREVYYFYVTHFRSQKECDAAIMEAAKLLRVPRSSLGLFASPKGWFCGCIQILREGRVVMDGQALSSIQGAPITQEWLHPESQREFTIGSQCSQEVPQQQDDDDDAETASMLMEDGTVMDTQASSSSSTDHPRRHAKCILVIEKEGVYNRFSEDRLYERFPCILVTGKGFPDLATRSFVHTVHQQLQLPVYGIADCNPYGVLVLYTYQHGSDRIGVDGGSRYSVPIQWLGLRPSQVEEISASNNNAAASQQDHDDDDSSTESNNNNPTLPPGVYQELTDLDRKRLAQLLHEDHKFHGCGANQDRYEELEMMEENGYKVELESLNWLGMDYMARWVFETLTRHDEYLDQVHDEEQEQNRRDDNVDDGHADDLSATGASMDQSNAGGDKTVASLSSNHSGPEQEQERDEEHNAFLPVII